MNPFIENKYHIICEAFYAPYYIEAEMFKSNNDAFIKTYWFHREYFRNHDMFEIIDESNAIWEMYDRILHIHVDLI